MAANRAGGGRTADLRARRFAPRPIISAGTCSGYGTHLAETALIAGAGNGQPVETGRKKSPVHRLT